MDVYTARQPIFDRKKDIFAYELLFRGGTPNFFPNIDGDCATSRVLSSTFFTTGIEKITGRKKALVNFTRDLLLNDVPLMFPPEKTIIEILEDVEPEEDVLEICRNLSRQGYSLALDDFVYHPKLDPLIELVDIIKVDFRLTGNKDVREYVKLFVPRGKKLLAEKVETYDEFQMACDMGFFYFQGYFFSKPQVLVEKDIPSLKMNLLQIMAESNKDEFSIQEIKKLITRDVGISFKLLRYMNSPYFRRLCEISSIHHAIVLLGELGVRRFLSVIMMSELIQDKPDELLRSSIITARMCEQLGLLNKRIRPNPAMLFTLGLFSLIDAILDDTMENILGKLPLSHTIKSALLGETSDLSEYLLLTESYEMGQWDAALNRASVLGIDSQNLPAIYQDAITWADALYSMA
jgi:EAL and modified HD-GYP domain-containing signal transduction protein